VVISISEQVLTQDEEAEGLQIKHVSAFCEVTRNALSLWLRMTANNIHLITLLAMMYLIDWPAISRIP